jgi:hypothetical protein
VNELSQILADIQQDAAAMPDGKLRTEIAQNVNVLIMVLDQLENLRPGVASADQVISATGDVISASLIIALYVCEWAKRPTERTWMRLSFN